MIKNLKKFRGGIYEGISHLNPRRVNPHAFGVRRPSGPLTSFSIIRSLGQNMVFRTPVEPLFFLSCRQRTVVTLHIKTTDFHQI